MPSIMLCLGFTTSCATPNASSILTAEGSIRNSLGLIASTLTSITLSSCSILSLTIVPSIGTSTGYLQVLSATDTLPIPVPYIAPLRNTSHSASLQPVDSKSSCNKFLTYSASLGSWSSISSLISNHLPLPNVASSISATDDSTACCSAGEIN